MAITVGELDHALLIRYPADTACDWDVTGLTVGDRSDVVTKVAVTLDPTVSAIRQAHKAGANVLLTHHPAVFGKLDDFVRADSPAIHHGAAIYEAAHLGVNLIDLHTALDCSAEGAAVMPYMLGLAEGPALAENTGSLSAKVPLGVGRINYVLPKQGEVDAIDILKSAMQGKPVAATTLKELAEKCNKAFKTNSQVWGDLNTELAIIATCSGSASGPEIAEACISNHVNCLVCGEISYHNTLDLAQAGICIIKLGHDKSEIPYNELLKREAVNASVSEDDIVILDQSRNWQTLSLGFC